MRLLKVLVPVVLIALLAACSQPLEPELDSGGVIVVTAGVAVESGAGPALRPQAQVQPGGVTLDGGGSVVGLQLCVGDEVTLVANYDLNGNQGSPARYRVPNSFDWNGSGWVADGYEERDVSAGVTNYSDTFVITVTRSSVDGAGESTFSIAPEILDPGSTNPKLQLNPNSAMSVTVILADCPVDNSPPVVTVDEDPLEVEATGPLTPVHGAVVANVDASDPDGDDLSFTYTYGVLDPTENELTPDTELPLGVYLVRVAVSDGQETTDADFTLIVQDTTPPSLEGAPASPLIADDIDGAPLDTSGLTATDLVDPDPAVYCSPEQLPIGVNEVTCYAEDASGNQSEAHVFEVVVTFANVPGGFLSPFKHDHITAKAGSTIPFKFLAPSYSGGLATDLASGLRFVLTPVDGASDVGVDEDTFEDYAAGSTAWRYVPEDEHYIFNLKTLKGWKGVYEATVSFQGIVLATGTVTFR